MNRLLTHPLKVEFCSPNSFLIFAGLFTLLYLASRWGGLEEYTSFLSGTNASATLSWKTAAALGLIHLVLHFAFILLVPISLLTAGLIKLWQMLDPARSMRPASESNKLPSQ